MTNRTFIRRSAALMAGAALSLAFTPAMAAVGNVLQLGVGQAGSSPVEPGQRLDLPGPAAQVMLDDGTVVSFVGASSLTVGADGSLTIHSGAATVLAGTKDVSVNLPGGVTAVVGAGGGAGTFTPTPGGYAGNVLSGGMTVTSGGRSGDFRAGQSWQAGDGAPAARVFANAAQPVVGPTRVANQNPALPTFPSGDALALVAFAQSLADLYGGGFEGAGPELINAYLAYLAEGGVPADFQADYGALIAQYIALLREGGLPMDFEGPGQTAILAYLNYLREAGGLDAMPEQDRAFIEAYLGFLGGGGAGGDFAGFYVQAINAYLAYLEEGGLPSDYTGLSQALIAQYLALLQSTGLLESLLGEQSAFLLAYLDYISGGGDPDDFEGLPEGPEEPEEPGGPDPGPGDPPVTGTVLPQFAGGDYNVATYGVSLNHVFAGDDKRTLAFAEDGGPTQFYGYTRTTAKVLAGGGNLNEGWLIGRFGDGGFTTSIGLTENYGPQEGVHFVIMKPVTAMPQTGTVEYALHAYTAPTYAGGGAISNVSATGEMTINFGTMKWGFTSQIKFDNADGQMTYDLSMSDGGNAMPGLVFMRGGTVPALAGESAYMKVTTNDPKCAGGCTALFNFLLGGTSADLAGGAYLIRKTQTVLGGALLFRAGPAEPEAPVSGTPRTGQVIAYSGSTIGIDARSAVTTTTETDGTLNKYVWTTEPVEAPQRGTNQSLETGVVAGVIGWSRWAGGTTAGQYYTTPAVTRTANQGMSLVYGTPATNLPTSGTVNYALVGATKPTIRDGSAAPGTFSGSAAVAFGSTAKVGLDMQVGIGGHTYSVATTGGVTTPASSQLSVGSDMMFSHYGVSVASGGPACATGTCQADITGFLAGTGASHLGVAYTIGNGGSSFDKQVDGVAVFGRP